MSRVKNCVKKADQVKINEYYDMTVENLQEIRDAYKNQLPSMLYAAFRFGYLQGQKAQRAEEKKRSNK